MPEPNQAEQLKAALEQASAVSYIPASNWSRLIFTMKDGAELALTKHGPRIIHIVVTRLPDTPLGQTGQPPEPESDPPPPSSKDTPAQAK